MTDADIKKVVNATIDSMLRKNMLRYNDSVTAYAYNAGSAKTTISHVVYVYHR